MIEKDELEALRRVFFAETQEHFAEMEASLLALEQHPSDPALVQSLFRVAHTIKGNAAMVGMDALAEHAHGLEDLLHRVRSGACAVTPPLVNLLLAALDDLKELSHAEPGAPATGAQRASLEAVRRFAEASAPEAEGPGERAPAGPESPDAPSRARTLRVDVARLDRMLDLVGEIAVARQRVTHLLESAEAVRREVVLDMHHETGRLQQDLQDLVLKVRMVPIGPVFRGFARTVRDAAASRGKLARLQIEGDDVEVDTSVVDGIRDPLLHIVRNAVDHGIEPSEARRAAGKDPCGTITFRARREGGSLVVEVADDGAGLDRERILARARQRGLVLPGHEPSEPEVHELIFRPGFSTAETVTELSGRGVGMDVVKRNVASLRGGVGVASRAGEGTTLTIRLPLTLAVIPGFVVAAGGERYVVPLESIVECVELPPGASGAEDAGVADLRGTPLPYVRLRRVLGGGDGAARESLVVIEQGRETAGLAVDMLLGETQIVVKPLGRPLSDVRGVSGSTVLGDGRVALILDVAALLREARAA